MTSPTAPEETIVWRGTPSQWTNFGSYFFCLVVTAAIIAGYFLITPPQPLILLGLIIPVLWMLSRWIGTRCQRYEITSERIKITTGLLSRHSNEIELYRVRDYKLTQPFWLRLFGLGNIVVSTTDNSNPTVVLQAIRDAAGHREEIRKYVEICRDKKRVRITEFES